MKKIDSILDWLFGWANEEWPELTDDDTPGGDLSYRKADPDGGKD